MVSETFELLNEKEERLTGLIETESPRKKQPVIIFLNGFLDTMDSPVKSKLAKKFLKEGFVTVRFDYTYGFGSGSGKASWFTPSFQVLDIERVLDHVTRRGYVKPEKILLIGHCFGGMAALLSGAFEDRVAAVVTISSPYFFEDTRVTRHTEREMSRIRLKRYFHLDGEEQGDEVRIDYTFLEDGKKKDMARAVRNLTQPLLVIHGRTDESIPTTNAQEIYDRAPGVKQLEIIESMGHHPTEKHVTALHKVIRPFIKEHLKV